MRIAYLDDDDEYAALLMTMLTRLGHQVSLFHKPAPFMTALEMEPPAIDAFITDYHMPDGTGGAVDEAIAMAALMDGGRRFGSVWRCLRLDLCTNRVSGGRQSRDPGRWTARLPFLQRLFQWEFYACLRTQPFLRIMRFKQRHPQERLLRAGLFIPFLP